jgi:hypothetical protein
LERGQELGAKGVAFLAEAIVRCWRRVLSEMLFLETSIDQSPADVASQRGVG